MKILAIHNFHRTGSASGDDQVFKAETRLLEDHGHQVVRYSVCNDAFDNAGAAGKLVAALAMFWSPGHARAVKALIEREKPDIVHVHTFFPLLSPSILYAAKRCGVPVAATLHDTRFICPCATSLRGTELCNCCGDGHYLRMVRYGCYKGSRLQSLLVAMNFKLHRWLKTYYRQIDRYICLNDNQIRLLTEIGFDPAKIVKKYNFVEDADVNAHEPLPDGLPPRYAVFYGRIGEEKGVRVLMKIAEATPEIPLVVMGGGPLEGEFARWAEDQGHVRYLGYTPHALCLSIARNAAFVLFPSIWYEGCSMVEIEAQSLGLPIIATDLGFSHEAIQDGYNGRKVPLGDVAGFVKAARDCWGDPEACRTMGENARREYVEKYQPEENYRQLESIYRELTGKRETRA